MRVGTIRFVVALSGEVKTHQDPGTADVFGDRCPLAAAVDPSIALPGGLLPSAEGMRNASVAAAACNTQESPCTL